jgi:N,N'-diacetyllegionaminate synthase
VVIAEIGSVHDGSFGNAKKAIELASYCGADAVKFQTHLAEAESRSDAPRPAYFQDESRIDYFRRTGFSEEQWLELRKLSEKLNLQFISSPFALEAVDLLESIGIHAYKIASGEVTNIPLLERVAQKGRSVYLSSGMSSWSELDAAVSILTDVEELTVMQCSSIYPCPDERVGLNVLAQIKERYPRAKVGYSDHTLGLYAPVAATALGATVIEKHLTFSRMMYGSDAPHSLEPKEFKQMVEMIRGTERIMAHPVDKDDGESFREMKTTFQKSIVAAEDIPSGAVIEKRHLAYKKPDRGLPASQYKDVIGKRLKHHKTKDEYIMKEDIE